LTYRSAFTRRQALQLGAAAAATGLMPKLGWAAGESLSLWHGWTGADNTTALNGVIDIYNKLGGPQVQPTAYDWDTFFSKWVVAAAGGQAPDLVLFHVSEIPQFTEKGLVRPLEDVVSSAKIDLGTVPPSGVKQATWDGKLRGIPLDSHPIAMYYNVDLVTAAGLDPTKPPKTGDEFLEWAKKLTVKDATGKVSQYGFELPITWATARWTWFSLLHQFGGTFIGDNGKAAVDSDASRKALQYLVDLIKKYEVASYEVGGNKGEDAFASKQVAMKFIGPWEVNLRMAQKLNFMTAPLPVFGEKPAAWANAHCMSLTQQKSDAKTEAGGAFMKWFFDNFALPATTVGIIPQGSGPRASKDFTGTPQYKYYQAFIDELPYVVYEPSLPNYLSVFAFDKPTPLVTNLQAALSGSKSVDEALKDMKAGLDQQIGKS
jgi:multiple sugar transport system substrate-binding protein